MFELADRLVGIYKTDNCTKSITINPGSFGESMKVVQCAQLRVLLNVTTLVSFSKLTTLNVTLVVSSWNRGSSGIVVCCALCEAVCYVKYNWQKQYAQPFHFSNYFSPTLLKSSLTHWYFTQKQTDTSCFASKPRYTALRALLMFRIFC